MNSRTMYFHIYVIYLFFNRQNPTKKFVNYVDINLYIHKKKELRLKRLSDELLSL